VSNRHIPAANRIGSVNLGVADTTTGYAG
jgi:hypothetical protein